MNLLRVDYDGMNGHKFFRTMEEIDRSASSDES